MKNEEITPKRRAWRPKEVAEMLGLSISQVRNDIRSGKLKTVRIGRAILILDEDLEDYINSYKNDSSNQDEN